MGCSQQMWNFSEILLGFNELSNSNQSEMLEQLYIEEAEATALTPLALQFILL